MPCHLELRVAIVPLISSNLKEFKWHCSHCFVSCRAVPGERHLCSGHLQAEAVDGYQGGRQRRKRREDKERWGDVAGVIAG